MAMFNKRHYEALATVIQDAERWAINNDQREGVARVKGGLAVLFGLDNSSFDESRFLHACKPGSNVRARTAHLAS